MRYLYILFIPFFISNLFAVDATLKIKKSAEERTHIAIVDGSYTKSKKLFNIFHSDFKISGHFLADKKHYYGDISTNYIEPKLRLQEYIIKYAMSNKSNLTLFIRVLKASNSEEIFKKSYTIRDKKKMPFLVHKAVWDINNILNYPDISWINRYILYSVYTKSRKSEIRLADYTFNYSKTIIKGGLNLFPKWADLQQRSFYYTSYREVIPTLYKLNLYSGKKEKIIDSEGMLVCSDVSKNGSKILLTMAPEGQADIYELDVVSKRKRRVTKFRGIDVNGRYIDEENRIVFVSNRLGYPNIFKKSINSYATSQMIYHGRNNNACDAYDTKIVYSSRESRRTFGDNLFNIYLASSRNRDTRPLTSTGSNQFPRFSIDGSVVLFLKQRGRSSSIGYINLSSSQSLLFPFSNKKVQSIDW